MRAAPSGGDWVVTGDDMPILRFGSASEEERRRVRLVSKPSFKRIRLPWPKRIARMARP